MLYAILMILSLCLCLGAKFARGSGRCPAFKAKKGGKTVIVDHRSWPGYKAQGYKKVGGPIEQASAKVGDDKPPGILQQLEAITKKGELDEFIEANGLVVEPFPKSWKIAKRKTAVKNAIAVAEAPAQE